MIDIVFWSSKRHEIVDSASGPLNSWHIEFPLLFTCSSFQVFWPCSWCVYQLSLTAVLLGSQITKFNLRFRNSCGFTVRVLTADGSFPTLHVPAMNGYRIVSPTLCHHPPSWYNPAQAPCLYTRTCTRVHTHANRQHWFIETWKFSSCAL